MKKSLVTTLIAAPLLSLSSMAFAAEPAAEPMLLSAAEMDGVTAGQLTFVFKRADVTQVNVSPVTVVQLSGINVSSGGGPNTALITSGNFSTIRQ